MDRPLIGGEEIIAALGRSQSIKVSTFNILNPTALLPVRPLAIPHFPFHKASILQTETITFVFRMRLLNSSQKP
jgi:hypothetical protein